MSIRVPELPPIPAEQQTPEVLKLMQVAVELRQLALKILERVDAMADELARQRKTCRKPKFPAQTRKSLDDDDDSDSNGRGGTPRPPFKKRKTAQLPIHDTKEVHPPELPPGAKFVCFRDWYVQDIILQAHNPRYRQGGLPPARRRTGVRQAAVRRGRLFEHHPALADVLEGLPEVGLVLSNSWVPQFGLAAACAQLPRALQVANSCKLEENGQAAIARNQTHTQMKAVHDRW